MKTAVRTESISRLIRPASLQRVLDTLDLAADILAFRVAYGDRMTPSNEPVTGVTADGHR